MTRPQSDIPGPAGEAVPDPDCDRCPRLAEFRQANRAAEPRWHNAPVPSFGDLRSSLLIVGLAPGRGGANRTGRPFTGDAAGDLLYSTLVEAGFAEGAYKRRPDDGLRLLDCRVTNAVRCVPPENRPTGAEIRACNAFLAAEIRASSHVRVLLALGAVAHRAILSALGARGTAYPFRHGAWHAPPSGHLIADSYHCSRYNTNTGRLTPAMFRTVFAEIRDRLPPIH